MVSQAINLTEIARFVTRAIADKALGQNEIVAVTPAQVNSVYKCIGQFVSFLIKKAQDKDFVADIHSFGTVVRTSIVTEFIPAHALALETAISKSMPSRIDAAAQKQELAFGKISAVAQLPESTVAAVLAQTAKAIGHFTRNEKQTVVADFGLINNEVLVFDRQSCVFIDKSKLRDSM